MTQEILKPGLMVIGSRDDFNLVHLIEKAQGRGIDTLYCLNSAREWPAISYDVTHNHLTIAGKIVQPQSVFIRPHMFLQQDERTLETWHITHDWFLIFMGWMLSNPDIKMFNRKYYASYETNKLLTLRLAVAAGLAVPETYYTNDLSFINRGDIKSDFITKPVEGGAYCRMIGDDIEQSGGRTQRAQTIQKKLVSPEVRVYRIGDNLRALKLESPDLDYRIKQTATITPLPFVPEEIAGPFMRLTDSLGLDFCAADFKTCAATDRLLLLEVNSGPFFSRFDNESGGQITDAMLDYLTGTASTS